MLHWPLLAAPGQSNGSSKVPSPAAVTLPPTATFCDSLQNSTGLWPEVFTSPLTTERIRARGEFRAMNQRMLAHRSLRIAVVLAGVDHRAAPLDARPSGGSASAR